MLKHLLIARGWFLPPKMLHDDSSAPSQDDRARDYARALQIIATRHTAH